MRIVNKDTIDHARRARELALKEPTISREALMIRTNMTKNGLSMALSGVWKTRKDSEPTILGPKIKLTDARGTFCVNNKKLTQIMSEKLDEVQIGFNARNPYYDRGIYDGETPYRHQGR